MKERIISAIIMLLIFVPLIIFGGIYFKIGLTLLGVLSIKELLDLKSDIPKSIKILSYILVSSLIFFSISNMLKVFIIFLIYMTLLLFYKREKYNVENAVYLISFTLFITLIFSFMYQIRDNDIYIFIYLILISTITDTFAYFGGKYFGSIKLAEDISPNKTVEGLIIGGILGTIFPASFYLYMIAPGDYFIVIILLTLILNIVGQLGDLIFSSIKRYYKVKDFSSIIKGHGGILDRLDSIIFIVIGYIVIINLI